MRIALVHPSKASDDKQLPLGLAYLTSFILSRSDDLIVKIVDTGVAKSRERRDFLNDRYDLIGFSVTSLGYHEAVELAQVFRKTNPRTPIVFGGPHVSLLLEQVMNDEVIDLAVYGEGELTFDELLRSFKSNGNVFRTEELAGIKGLIYRTSGQVLKNAPRELIQDLDALPFPAFHLFSIERYPGKYPMITSRGCPFACVFCASSQIWGRKWRARSPENVIAEVEYIIRNFRARPIDFHDDGFNMSLDRVNAICDLFLEKRLMIPWGVRGLRADIINTEVAKKMHRAGCTHVAIGIESANNDMLTQMGKKETIETIEEGINCLRAAGIDVIGQFMIGNPGETLETVKESIKFAVNSKLSKSTFGTAVPFPGTGLWKYVEEKGKFLVEKDCTQFDELSPRIIFETPEFTKEHRLEALRLVEQAGIMPHGIHEKGLWGNLKSTLRSIWFRFFYGYLPQPIAYRIYLILRKVKAVVS